DININTRSLLPDARKLRKQLRDKEAVLWSQLPHKGKGVVLYNEYTPANQWIRDHQGLSY
ncbi:hypothetical protein L9F63_020246, partial [Diploptera punctata]